MNKFRSKGVDQEQVNAALVARFGSTVTRQELLQYREETGIDPKWIRRNDACRVGRGSYQIPTGKGSTPAGPIAVAPAATRKMGKHERVVLPTPFDDGEYDESAEDAAPVEGKKRGRAPKVDAMDALVNQPDYDPTIQERAMPVFIHAWICPGDNCPGRKRGDFFGPDMSAPKCECGTEMVRHSWTKKTRF